MNNRNVCPTLPKAGKSLLKTETDSVSGEDLLPGSQMTISLPCVHMQKRTRELSEVSFKRTRIPFFRDSHDPISPQRTQLQILWHRKLGFNMWILGWGEQHKHSASSNEVINTMTKNNLSVKRSLGLEGTSFQTLLYTKSRLTNWQTKVLCGKQYP